MVSEYFFVQHLAQLDLNFKYYHYLIEGDFWF